MAAQRSLRKLGLDLALARRRRRLTQGSLAERMGASVSTVKRMEAGDPKVPIHFFARAMGIFGELDSLANVMDATKDQLGLSLENENLPKRVRAQSTQSRGNAGAM
ncbi:MAG: helix-turn-helix domain-containing protein [Dokdonella sp.]